VKSLIATCSPPICACRKLTARRLSPASAAHELKTPLAVIKGYYDLLLSGSLGKLTDKQRDILQNRKIAASGWFAWSRCS